MEGSAVITRLAWVPRFLIWCGRFVVEGRSGNPSVKRVGLAMAVTVLCLVMGAMGGVCAGVTLAAAGKPEVVELVRILTNTLIALAGLVLTAVTTGYLVDKHSQRKVEAQEKSDEPT